MSAQQIMQTSSEDQDRIKELKRVVRRIEGGNRVGVAVLWVIMAIVAILFVGIILYLLIQGAAYLFRPVFYGQSNAKALEYED